MNYEIALLNAVVDSGDILGAIEQNIDNVFVDHSDIWSFIQEHFNSYKVIPTKATIKQSFPDFPALLTQEPLQYYIDEARKLSLESNIKISIAKTLETLKTSGPDEALNFLTSQGYNLTKNTGKLKDVDIAADYVDRIVNLRERLSGKNNGFLGIPSGLTVIDAFFGGWQPGDFITIMGWAGIGKSSLALLFAANSWVQGYRPLVVSLEMDRQQVEYRIDTIINGGKFFKNSELMTARDIDIDVYEKWVKETYDGKHPFHLVTSEGMERPTQNVVQAKIEQYKPDLVVIDYHSLLEDARRGGTTTEQTKNLSQDLKLMAVRNRVPIIDIVSVTMPSGQQESRAPLLSEMAWSRQLSYDSDLSLSVHRDAIQNSNILEVHCRKNRRGKMFAFYLNWDIDSGEWKEMYDVEQ